MIGLMLGVATIMVMTVGGWVISDHLNGRLTLEDGVRFSGMATVSVR